MKKLYQHQHYPMFVVFVCMMLVVVSNGLINAGMSVLDESFLAEFGWSMAQLKLRDSINFIGAAVLVIGSGYALDRVGFKPLLLLGLVMLSGAYFAYSYVQNLTQVYALHILFAVAIACCGNMVSVIAAASTMPERRGLAIGFTVAGTSVGGIVMPPFANWLNQTYGWRDAMRIEALLPLLMFVVVAIFVRNIVSVSAKRSSESKASAKKETVRASDVNKNEDGLSFAQAVRTPQFYLVAIAASFTFYAILALYSHLFLFMRGLDFTPATASLGISALSAAALCGKISSGWLSDLSGPFVLLRINMLTMLIGLSGIFYLPVSYVWLFLVITGFGWGGLHTLYNFVLMALFGMRSVGKIISTVSVAQSAGAGIGAATTGLLFDAKGDYSLAFAVVVGLMAAGFLLTLALKPLKN